MLAFYFFTYFLFAFVAVNQLQCTFCKPVLDFLSRGVYVTFVMLWRGGDGRSWTEAIVEPAPDDLVIAPDGCDQPLLQGSTLLREAVSTVAAAGAPVPVVNDQQQVIGVVTPQGLLHAIGNQ